MTTIRSHAALIPVVFCTLSACGGSGSSSDMTPTDPPGTGAAAAQFVGGLTQVTRTATSTGDIPTAITLNGQTRTVVPTFYFTADNTPIYSDGTVLFYEAQNDGVQVGVVQDWASGTFLGGELTPLDAAQLPQSGSATFSGDYLGLIEDGFLTARAVVTGDATFVADFSDMSINGTITNRVVADSHLFTLDNRSWITENLVFQDLSIDDEGFYGGTISVDSPTFAPTGTGLIDGVIAGNDTGAIIGVDHINSISGTTVVLGEAGTVVASQ